MRTVNPNLVTGNVRKGHGELLLAASAAHRPRKARIGPHNRAQWFIARLSWAFLAGLAETAKVSSQPREVRLTNSLEEALLSNFTATNNIGMKKGLPMSREPQR